MLEVDRFEIFSLRSSSDIFADIFADILSFFQDSRRVQKYQKIYGQEIALRNITVFDELYCEEHFGM